MHTGSALSLREQHARSFAALLRPLDPADLGPEPGGRAEAAIRRAMAKVL